MSLRINREQLINELQMVRGGVSAREFIEQSSCFVFMDGRVLTFNDEVACRKKTCLNGIEGAVQAQHLLEILDRIPDDELEVEGGDNGELLFRGKRKEFGVVMDSEIHLPIDKVEVPTEWKELSPEFTEAVGLVQHCVSTDENKFMLTCIHISEKWIEACDNLQLMRCRMDTGIQGSVLVRGTSLQNITQLAMSKIALTKSWIHFRNKSGLTYSCRRYSEEYPMMGKVLKIEGHPVVIPRGLAEAAERAAVFAADKAEDALVSVMVKPGMLRIRGDGISGWYKETKKTTYEGPRIEFVISPELLKHISEKYKEAQISEDKLKVDGGTWSYITVLGRHVKKETAEAPKAE